MSSLLLMNSLGGTLIRPKFVELRATVLYRKLEQKT